MPKVSVIIPTYNRAKFISRAIDSVLNQTFQDLEIIVIDDGSIDETKNILEKYQKNITYLYQQNGGVSAARNFGIRSAKGEYIAFLDSDDIWIPEKLSIQIPILENNRKIGIVYSKLTILNENNEPCGVKPKNYIGKDFKDLIEKGGDLPTSSVITKKECFEKAGLFDESFSVLEDIDMWIRIAEQYDIYQITDKNLAFYYKHNEQISNDKIKLEIGAVEIDKKALRIFKNIPQAVINKRLSANEYTLSRSYYLQSKTIESFRYLTASISRNPLVGLSFIDSQDNIFKKILKFFKPYIFFIICMTKTSIIKTSLKKNI